MLTLYSFLQRVFLIVRSMTAEVKRKIYGHSVIFISSISVIAIVALTSGSPGSGGGRTLTVFAETNSETMETAEGETEEIETVTEADIQVDLTDSRRQGQQFVGELLLRDIRRKEESRQKAQAEIEELKKQILEEENERKQAEEEAERASAVVPCSQEDYQILLRIVQAEAGICDDRGKVLVANVILNRVKSKEFPNSIKAVVYQKSQFSPVSNGSINTCEVTQQTINCVNRALSGEDYSQGALYFMNRGGARSGAADWFDGQLTFLFQHEKHEFFK